MKRKIWQFVFLASLVSSLLFLKADHAQASTRSQAMKAYNRLLSISTIDWGDGKYYPTGNLTFTLAYIDKDNVPELLLYSDDVPHVAGYGKAYTYRNGKLVTISSCDDIGFYKKSGVFCEEYETRYAFYTAYKVLKKGKTCEIARITENKPDPDTLKMVKKYTDKKGRSISKKQFQKIFKKYAGKQKLSGYKVVKNTASNRKKYFR